MRNLVRFGFKGFKMAICRSIVGNAILMIILKQLFAPNIGFDTYTKYFKMGGFLI